jgi:glycosyltransferase involved in cell wall biosynthesis
MNSENSTKFSIIIPTLNEEKYVGVLLEALCKQDFKDFEVIVVDAKSPDKTREVVEKYLGKLDLRFVLSPKKGVSYQRNYGAKLAKYDHLVFFDADVDPEKKFLTKIAEYIREKPAGILTSWNIPISEKPIDDLIYWVHNQILLEGVKKLSPGAVGTFIYVQKRIFNQVGGFDESISFGEDWDLAKRVFERGYKYTLLKDPKIRVSIRRFDKEGRSGVVWKNIKAVFMYNKNGAKGLKGKFKHEVGQF